MKKQKFIEKPGETICEECRMRGFKKKYLNINQMAIVALEALGRDGRSIRDWVRHKSKPWKKKKN